MPSAFPHLASPYLGRKRPRKRRNPTKTLTRNPSPKCPAPNLEPQQVHSHREAEEPKEEKEGFDLKPSASSRSIVVQPLGNLLLLDPSANARNFGLGALYVLSNELILDILGLLGGRDLGVLSAASRSSKVGEGGGGDGGREEGGEVIAGGVGGRGGGWRGEGGSGGAGLGLRLGFGSGNENGGLCGSKEVERRCGPSCTGTAQAHVGRAMLGQRSEPGTARFNGPCLARPGSCRAVSAHEWHGPVPISKCILYCIIIFLFLFFFILFPYPNHLSIRTLLSTLNK